MVCLGNICRSPMAEGIMRKKIEDYGLEAEVDSAGTASYHVGEQPDYRAIENMHAHGIDIRMLRGRQFRTEDFDHFDRIYTMDNENHRNVLRLARNDEDRAKVDMMLNQLHPGSDSPVPDPWYGGPQGFEDVFNLLDAACEEVAKDLSGES